MKNDESTWYVESGDWQAECLLAASNDEAFARFRQLPMIRTVVENRQAECLLPPRPAWRAALSSMPSLPDFLERIAENDRVGGAVRDFEALPGLWISATTAFYAVDLAAIHDLFGPLDEMRIAEIGGGYGGMASIVTRYFGDVNYTIFDTPEANALQRRYLTEMGRRGVCFSDQILNLGRFDLVLSTCALCELTDSAKDEYARCVLARSERGFLVWNSGGSRPWFHGKDRVVPWLDATLSPRKAFCFSDVPYLAEAWREMAPERYAWGTV
jgi:hypothetical protein